MPGPMPRRTLVSPVFPQLTTNMPAELKPDGAKSLQAALDEWSDKLPGVTLALASTSGLLFSSSAGRYDVLDASSRALAEDDVMWFASTTKLLTAVAYLQLVDRGVVSLDTDMRGKYAPLDAAASRIFTRLDESGTAQFVPNDKAVPLGALLNQTSGFGMEFGEQVQSYKTSADKGTGFVNSCKVENLINTPLMFEPGSTFQYGNSAEWLGLILPSLVGVSTEDYFQENILRPLGMSNTTFYPFGEELKDRLVPLRFGGEHGYEVLTDQMPLLTLPRKTEDIEYPVAGGGIYSTSRDYIKLLSHLLSHYASLTGGAKRPESPLLSDASVWSLFSRSLPEAALPAMATALSHFMGVDGLAAGEADWSTGMSLYLPADGRRAPNGRHAGSAGWGGAAGTTYWIDPVAGVAAVFSTQTIPSSAPAVVAFKGAMERSVYAALA
ncbi:Acyltransferase LovD [Vanrija pseudolonga]|uniref:Acyltransferase LovD n=1 Tax=Vanrija pseudolonga TaxID=143232 RepID=A0AAF1BMJ6_9TREE|nr:Acyltransferase LovD [Vanrija pseudolonga]